MIARGFVPVVAPALPEEYGEGAIGAIKIGGAIAV